MLLFNAAATQQRDGESATAAAPAGRTAGDARSPGLALWAGSTWTDHTVEPIVRDKLPVRAAMARLRMGLAPSMRRSERASSLASVAPKVLGSTPHESEYFGI